MRVWLDKLKVGEGIMSSETVICSWGGCWCGCGGGVTGERAAGRGGFRRRSGDRGLAGEGGGGEGFVKKRDEDGRLLVK